MNPFYFGRSESPLFGVYHSPPIECDRHEGAVLCYPLVQEYMRSHWACRQLAHFLALAGFHVMRFDYFGTGDSAGETLEASLDRWQSDIWTSMEELWDISGVNKVSLVGLRFGGALALEVCRTDGIRVENVVLWDPVVNGRIHIEELENMHRELYRTFPVARKHFKASSVQEILGYPLSERMREEIEKVDLRTCRPGMNGRLIMVVSEEKDEYGAFRKNLEAANVKHLYTVLSDACDWGNIGDFYHRMSAAKIPRAIVDQLTRNGK